LSKFNKNLFWNLIAPLADQPLAVAQCLSGGEFAA
jgi:hypothetical protein